MSRAGIVLCGGRSSRMGRAKAWLPWFGGALVEVLVERLGSIVDEVIVVTSATLDLPALPARIVEDREPGLGPLAGLREGLAAARAERAFVTSVDAPFLTRAFVEGLFAMGGAAAPISEGHVQVLSAVYPCDAYRCADALLRQGTRRPLALLEALDYKPIELPASGDASGIPPAWRGFNTPAEYLAAVRAIDPDATAEVELLGRVALAQPTSKFRVPVGTLGMVLSALPGSLGLVDGDRVAKAHLVSLGGRDLVRDLAVPVGPGERVSVIDALAGG
jgi:molybdopterin-guanine dinucleotide biosynthesis protein A